MNDNQYVSQLLADLESETPEMAFQELADGQWLVAWSDHTIVNVEFDPEEHRLTLSTGVGQPDPEKRAAVHKSLLMYNTLWSDTGGVVMGMAEDDIVQHYSTCTCRLSPGEFASLLPNFVAKALIWRIWVAVGELDQLPDEAAPEEATPNALFV